MAKQRTIQPLPITTRQAKRRLDMYVTWINQLRETCPPEAEPAHAERAPTSFLQELALGIPGTSQQISIGEFHPYFNALAHFAFEVMLVAPPTSVDMGNILHYAEPIADARKKFPKQFQEATRTITPALRAAHEQLMRYRRDFLAHVEQGDEPGKLEIAVILDHPGKISPFTHYTFELDTHPEIAMLDGVLYPYLPLPAHILLVGQEATLGERTFTSSEVDIEGSVKATLNEYCPPHEQEKLAPRLKKIHEHQRSTLTEILALDAYDGLNKYILDKIFAIARQERDNAERELQHRQTEGGTGNVHHD